jgi:HEPN domain-containing protein
VADLETRSEAGRWLAKAARDTEAARRCRGGPEPLLDMAAYHCQQAAEKVAKALLVLAGEPLMRTHDLDALADAVVARFPQLATGLDAIRHLTPWATATRYPDLGGDAEPPDCEVTAALTAVDRLLAEALELAASG